MKKLPVILLSAFALTACNPSGAADGNQNTAPRDVRINTSYNTNDVVDFANYTVLECKDDPDEGDFYLEFDLKNSSFDRIDYFGERLSKEFNKGTPEQIESVVFSVSIRDNNIELDMNFPDEAPSIRYDISRQTGMLDTYVTSNGVTEHITLPEPIICSKIDSIPNFTKKKF